MVSRWPPTRANAALGAGRSLVAPGGVFWPFGRKKRQGARVTNHDPQPLYPAWGALSSVLGPPASRRYPAIAIPSRWQIESYASLVWCAVALPGGVGYLLPSCPGCHHLLPCDLCFDLCLILYLLAWYSLVMSEIVWCARWYWSDGWWWLWVVLVPAYEPTGYEGE